MRTFAAVLAVSLLSCSKAPPPAAQDAGAPSASTTPATTTSAPTWTLPADASPPSSSDAAPASPEDAGPSSCPAGMLLVEGDYCTDLALTCKKSWYAKWNDKTICEEFESPSVCSGKKVHKRFCIDLYEYPNKKGERPKVMFNFPQAQHFCAAEGKRVCTETEWTTACEGPEYKPYPYGYSRDPKICNGDQQGVEPAVTGHDQKGAPFMAFDSKDPAISGPELRAPVAGLGQRLAGRSRWLQERLRRMGHGRQCRRARVE